MSNHCQPFNVDIIQLRALYFPMKITKNTILLWWTSYYTQCEGSLGNCCVGHQEMEKKLSNLQQNNHWLGQKADLV